MSRRSSLSEMKYPVADFASSIRNDWLVSQLNQVPQASGQGMHSMLGSLSEQHGTKSSKASRQQLQKDIARRVAKARISKLSKRMSLSLESDRDPEKDNSATNVKRNAKLKGNMKTAMEVASLPEFLTFLHRKSLTLQGQRDVFQWLTDFCEATRNNTEVHDPGSSQFRAHHGASFAKRVHQSSNQFKSKILDKSKDQNWMREPG
jgi:hypothetical protein